MKRTIMIYVMITCMAFTFFAYVPCITGAHKANDWAQNSIDIANTYGIIPADMYVGDYTSSITRGEIASLVVNSYESIHGTIDFKDFSFTDTYGNTDINKICTLGIMNGRSTDIFSPYDNVTREEMAKIILGFKALVNGEELELPANPYADFSDFSSVSNWAKPYVAQAKAIGVFYGYDDNTFRCKESVSREMAIALILRCTTFTPKPRPEIISLTNGSVVSSDYDLNVNIQSENSAELHIIKKRGLYSHLNSVNCDSLGGFATIKEYLLDENSAYAVFAECNGVFSDVVNFYTDKVNIAFDISMVNQNGMYRISWDRIDGIDIYDIKITERRNSYYKDDIPPNSPIIYSLRWESSLDVRFNPNRTYTVEISGGQYLSSKDFYVSEINPEGGAEILSSYPTTKAEADKLMTTITVPVWKIKNGQKVSSTAYLTVHHKIADKVKLVFEEIYNGPEKFPIKDVGAYAWRGGKSEHNGGTAIDINANENYCIYNNGTVIGSYWKPYEDVYSITPYGDVVKAFEKYGFTWGGDSWRNPKDYMHFSYLGT